MIKYGHVNAYVSKRQQDSYRAVMNGIIANIYAAITVLAYAVAQSFFSGPHDAHTITDLSTHQQFTLVLDIYVIIGLFIGTTYAWLFFSRIFIFIEESEPGEYTSIGLACVGLITPIVIASAGKDVFLAGLWMGVGVAGVAWQVRAGTGFA